jgi:hypothetical protein
VRAWQLVVVDSRQRRQQDSLRQLLQGSYPLHLARRIVLPFRVVLLLRVVQAPRVVLRPRVVLLLRVGQALRVAGPQVALAEHL